MRTFKTSGFRLSCFFLLLFLESCVQDTSRKDIEKKLQGTWVGVVKDFDSSVINRLQVKIKGNNFGLRDIKFFENDKLKKIVPDYDMSYRVFIHSNGDTIVERKYGLPKSLSNEPTYAKLQMINLDTIRLIFLFKMREGVFTSDQVTGLYLKKIN
ncbi:hypothetical protein [Pedobacter sp.]|uniref:hypothetical protein n=1 Tax=Pedobacter sp. TaxID=1411316 RepID=UPI003BA91B40